MIRAEFQQNVWFIVPYSTVLKDRI